MLSKARVPNIWIREDALPGRNTWHNGIHDHRTPQVRELFEIGESDHSANIMPDESHVVEAESLDHFANDSRKRKLVPVPRALIRQSQVNRSLCSEISRAAHLMHLEESTFALYRETQTQTFLEEESS